MKQILDEYYLSHRYQINGKTKPNKIQQHRIEKFLKGEELNINDYVQERCIRRKMFNIR